MRITINNVTRCTGGNHVNVSLTTGSGRTGTLTFEEAEIRAVAQSNELDELRQLLLHRMVSAIKEANATTAVQMRNALVGKVFEV